MGVFWQCRVSVKSAVFCTHSLVLTITKRLPERLAVFRENQKLTALYWRGVCLSLHIDLIHDSLVGSGVSIKNSKHAIN